MSSPNTVPTVRATSMSSASAVTLNFGAGAAASVAAAVVTNPFDVLKVQQQLTTARTGAAFGIWPSLKTRVLEKGFVSLFDGTTAAIARALSYSTLRLGLYSPVKSTFCSFLPGREASFGVKLASGMTTGAIAASVANPIEVIKTRAQAEMERFGGSTYRTAAHLFKNDGLAGMFAGIGPHVVRGACHTATQLATYDQVKQTMKKHAGAQDGLSLQLGASLVSGIATTTVTAPLDLVKTRLMMPRADGIGRGVGGSNTAYSVISKIHLDGGASAFFKGWLPTYMRTGPHTLITFVALEQIRSLVGLGNM